MVLGEPSVRIRPARREDIPGVVAAHRTAVDPAEDAGFGTPLEERTFADPGRLERAWVDPNRVGSEEVLVAELGERVIGYVTVEDRARALELVTIDVARKHQGRGIGTRLVRFVEERARADGKEAVTLGTSRNAEGVPWKSFDWWRSLGYRVTHEEENAWTRTIGPAVREIRMRKDLRPLDQVELRAVRAEDLPIFFEQQGDPLANHMAAFTAKDPSDRNEFETHWTRILGDPEVMMRTITGDGRVVGYVGRFHDRELGKPAVAYWIGREDWGRGIATRALTALLREAAERPLYARASADNVGSIRVLEKCGFILAGRGRGFANARGRETDEVVMCLDGPAPTSPAGSRS